MQTCYVSIKTTKSYRIYEIDQEKRIAIGNRINGAVAGLMKRRNVNIDAPLAVYNAALVPTLRRCDLFVKSAMKILMKIHRLGRY